MTVRVVVIVSLTEERLRSRFFISSGVWLLRAKNYAEVHKPFLKKHHDTTRVLRRHFLSRGRRERQRKTVTADLVYIGRAASQLETESAVCGV